MKSPDYYRGIFKGIKANEIIDDFLLTYNIGTAVTYLLRAGKKKDNPKRQDIEKAIHHLQFELELLDKQKGYGKQTCTNCNCETECNKSTNYKGL